MIIEEYFPGTPATPGTPARYIELNGPSWSSGSVSIPLTPGEGGYKFQIPASVVGVFVGLATGYPGTGYFGIQHALYFSRGVVDVYESGQKVGTLGPYLSSDEFTLVRQAGRVWFLRNGIKEFDRPSRLAGTFRLASTQYLTGDKVVDAEVVGVGSVPTSGDGVAVLRPLATYGFETAPANWGVAELAPLTVTGSVDGHGWGTANLGPLTALGSDRPIAVGRATLAPLTGQAESGLLAPGFATGSSVIGPMQQVGRMIPGGIGAGLITTKLLALGSDRPIAQAHNELAPLFAWGAEGVGLRGGAITLTGRFKVVASARRVGVSGAMLEGPSLALTAFGGGAAKIKLPRLTMSGAGTIPVVARADLTLPSLQLEATGTASETWSVDAQLPGGFIVTGHGGGTAVLTIKGPFITSAEAVTVERAEAYLTGPGFYSVTASAHVDGTGSAILTLPALQPAPSGQAWLVLPSLTLRAFAEETVVASYESYAINLKTGAVSHYTNFPFDNIVRFGDRFYGVKSDGIFELTGNTDNGTNIDAKVTTFMTDFGSPNNKRVLWTYLLGRLDDGMNVTVNTDEGLSYTYPTVGANDGSMRTHRAKVGRGLKGNYFSFTFENVDGADFEIDHVDVLFDVTTRAR